MVPKMGVYSEQAQRLLCLLFVLHEMPIGGPRKRDVVEYIQRFGYLKLSPNDVEPYMTQIEPRWQTDIAFRRKDAVQHELLFNQTQNCWEITREGKDFIERVLAAAKDGRYDVRECYLWNTELKKAFAPSYVPSEVDAQRPIHTSRRSQAERAKLYKAF